MNLKWRNLYRHYSSPVLGLVTLLGSIQTMYPTVYAVIPPYVTVTLGILGLVAKIIPQDPAPAPVKESEPGPETVE